MRRISFVSKLAALLGLLLPCGGLLAQDLAMSLKHKATQDSLQSVQIRFLNSMTGYGVRPDEIVLSNKTRQKVKPFELKEGARLLLSLKYGSYNLSVRAQGYSPMATKFTIGPKPIAKIDLFLDPVQPPDELRPEFIKSLHRPKTTLIVGFVVDDESSEPLADVQVSLVGSQVRTITNSRGFFIIHIPVPEHFQGGLSTADILFEKPGYRAEEYRYIELWPNGDWIYRVRLERGKGKKVIDQRRHRRRSDDPLDKGSGFAPDTSESCQQCKTTLEVMAKPVNYAVDMDIKEFFDIVPPWPHNVRYLTLCRDPY